MAQTAVVIDYGSGNIRSVQKSLVEASLLLGSRHTLTVTSDPDVVKQANRIILPGVGAFGSCMDGLKALDGMIDALDEAVIDKGTPFLGICVGMQLMAREGLEHGKHEGLGWLGGRVEAIKPANKALKIPHMGWNDIRLNDTGNKHPVVNSLKTGDDLYFVHSYHLKLDGTKPLLATTEYGGAISAIVGRDNIIGTQFHPEKSQGVGLKFLQAFLRWTP